MYCVGDRLQVREACDGRPVEHRHQAAPGGARLGGETRHQPAAAAA